MHALAQSLVRPGFDQSEFVQESHWPLRVLAASHGGDVVVVPMQGHLVTCAPACT